MDHRVARERRADSHDGPEFVELLEALPPGKDDRRPRVQRAQTDEVAAHVAADLRDGCAPDADMRDVHDAVAAGDERVKTALDVYYHRIKGYVGKYYAELGHVDAITFTAGIGENDDIVRLNALAGLERLGIRVDPERNAGRVKEPKVISPDGAEVTVLVIPTNEELEIARQSVAAIA